MANMGTKACILLVVLIVLLCGLPTAFSCYAAPFVYGPTCRSGTSIIGSPGTKIRYSISVNGNTKICCQALSCRRGSCNLRSIGCGSGNWKSAVLPWGNVIATPTMKCRGLLFGSGYSFKH